MTLAVVALLLAAGGAFSLGTRPYAVRAAQSQFDALLRTARALASTSGNGATIVVEPRNANGSAAGFTATLYGGRPNAVPLASQNVPPLVVDANFAETSLGAPPLSIFLSSAGRATMLGGYPDRAHFDTPAVPAIADPFPVLVICRLPEATNVIGIPCACACTSVRIFV